MTGDRSVKVECKDWKIILFTSNLILDYYKKTNMNFEFQRISFRLVLLVLISIILIQSFMLLNIWKSSSNNMDQSETKYEEKGYKFSLKYNINKFKKIALKYGTDKVDKPNYEYVYGQLLSHIRFNSELNFLEIGLGCGMPYGPGKSIPVWREYLPNARISMFEYDERCARLFENVVDELYVGDQRDKEKMRKVGEQGGSFDIIVDGGGHSRKMQINSLIALWPFVKKRGGIYIIEDIFTSYLEINELNDNPEQSALDLMIELIVILNDPSRFSKDWKTYMPSNIKISQQARDLSVDVMSVNCFEGACALIKK
jgi:hypothetical protein